MPTLLAILIRALASGVGPTDSPDRKAALVAGTAERREGGS
jgi:hypothetical protein